METRTNLGSHSRKRWKFWRKVSNVRMGAALITIHWPTINAAMSFPTYPRGPLWNESGSYNAHVMERAVSCEMQEEFKKWKTTK
jgi:hypothetical protein